MQTAIKICILSLERQGLVSVIHFKWLGFTLIYSNRCFFITITLKVSSSLMKSSAVFSRHQIKGRVNEVKKLKIIMIVKWYSGTASLYREIFLISEKIRPGMLLCYSSREKFTRVPSLHTYIHITSLRCTARLGTSLGTVSRKKKNTEQLTGFRSCVLLRQFTDRTI